MKKKVTSVVGLLLLLVGLLYFSAVPVSAATVATISVSLPNQTVNPGDSFDVNLVITNTTPVYMWQVDVIYDTSKLTYVSITEGTFLKNNGTTNAMPPDMSTPGTLAAICYAMTGSASAPATTNGALAKLRFTAKTGVSGVANINLANVLLASPDGNQIPNSTVVTNNGSVTINSGSNNNTTSTTTSTTTTTTATTTTTTPSTTSTTSTSTTTATTPAPTVISFSPSTGGSGTSVTIYGTNFSGITAVKFGDNEANDYSVNSATKITASAGSGTTGKISVTGAGGTAVSSGNFTFTSVTSTSATQKSTSPTAAQTTTSSFANSNSMKIITTGNGNQAVKTTSNNINTSPSSLVSSTNGVHVLDISDSIDNSGLLLRDFQQSGIFYNGNNQVSVQIRSGTRGINADGSPVEAITLQPGNNIPPAPTGMEIISSVEFGPSAATFSNPIMVVMEYSPVNVNDKNLTFSYFNTLNNKWETADYTLDAQNHRVFANISHFSLYAIMTKGNGAVAGIGWSMVSTIILTEIIIGGIILFLFLQRKPNPRPLKPAPSVSAPAVMRSEPQNINNTNIAWDDILPANIKKGAPFKTQLEVIGGKVSISQNNGSLPLEIVNTGDTRLIVSLEYDPEIYPQGNAKIIVLSAEQFEKTKEMRK